MRWPWKKKIEPVIETSAATEPLKPGTCECGHRRSSHTDGTGKCWVILWVEGQKMLCACQIYIKRRDSDPEDPPKPPPDSGDTVNELERMYKLDSK